MVTIFEMLYKVDHVPFGMTVIAFPSLYCRPDDKTFSVFTSMLGTISLKATAGGSAVIAKAISD
jgi:hypothetical protein